jgi:hypothetical protein
MNIANMKDIAALERSAARRGRGHSMHAAANAGDITAVAAMLDYAIVEGAKMRLPLFVCLLRLALLALKEESETEPKAERVP